MHCRSWKNNMLIRIPAIVFKYENNLILSRTTDWCALAAHHNPVVSSSDYLISHWLAISSLTNEKSVSIKRKPLDYGARQGRISQSSLIWIIFFWRQLMVSLRRLLKSTMEYLKKRIFPSSILNWLFWNSISDCCQDCRSSPTAQISARSSNIGRS